MVNLRKQNKTLGLSASYLFNWLLLAGTSRVCHRKEHQRGVTTLKLFLFVILDTIDYVNVIFVAHNIVTNPEHTSRMKNLTYVRCTHFPYLKRNQHQNLLTKIPLNLYLFSQWRRLLLRPSRSNITLTIILEQMWTIWNVNFWKRWLKVWTCVGNKRNI